MQDKPLLYIACPYSSTDLLIQKERFKKVSKFAGKLVQAGNLVYSPISHSAPMAWENKMGAKFSDWELLDFFYIDRADIVIVYMLEGWEESVGIAQELERAIENGKPVIYFPEIF